MEFSKLQQMPLEVCAIFMLDMAGSGQNLENSSGYCWKSVLFPCWMLLEVGGILKTPMNVVGHLCCFHVGCCRKWVGVVRSHCTLLHAGGKGLYVDRGEQMLLDSTGVHWYHPFSHQSLMKSIDMCWTLLDFPTPHVLQV